MNEIANIFDELEHPATGRYAVGDRHYGVRL